MKFFFQLQRLILLHLGVLFLVSPSVLWAREDLVPGSRYTSGRGAALGDAFLPLGNDGPSAMFYNPALWSKIPKTQVEPFDLSYYLNSGFLSLSSAQSLNATSLSSYASKLQNNRGVYAGEGFSLLPSYYMPDFGFGLLMQSHLGAIANPDGSITYRSTYQMIPTFGGGIKLAGGIVRLGYSLQWVNEAVGTVTTLNPVGYNQGLQQGSAISHNLGASLTLPMTYLPSFNVVARNVLGAHYSAFSAFPLGRNSIGAPATEPMSIDASFSFMMKVGAGTIMNFVLEDRDLTNISAVPQKGRMALGTELNVRETFFLRGGWGSGYPAAGFGFKRKTGELSITWYSEDVGTTYHSLRDNRYLFQYKVGVF